MLYEKSYEKEKSQIIYLKRHVLCDCSFLLFCMTSSSCMTNVHLSTLFPQTSLVLRVLHPYDYVI